MASRTTIALWRKSIDRLEQRCREVGLRGVVHHDPRKGFVLTQSWDGRTLIIGRFEHIATWLDGFEAGRRFSLE